MISACCGQNKGRLLGETLPLKAITLADFFHQGSPDLVPGGHCNTQWQTSSTSPLWHSLHIFSFLSTPCHLPTSIWNAAMPTLSLIIILLSLFSSKPHNVTTIQSHSFLHHPQLWFLLQLLHQHAPYLPPGNT